MQAAQKKKKINHLSGKIISLPLNSNKDLMRYAGLAMQMMASLAIAVFAGLKADKWIKLSFPVFTWLLPLLALAAILYKIVKDTGRDHK